MSEEQKYTYRVKPGYTHGAFDQYKAGDTLQLTEAEAAGLLDKLERVSGAKASPKPATDLVEGGLLVTQRVPLRQAIAQASDEELLEIPGIGEKSLEPLREWAYGISHSIDPATVTTQTTSNAQGVTATSATPDEQTPPVDNPPASFDVTGSKPAEVLAAIREGKITAQNALTAEQQGGKRQALLAELTKLAEAENKPSGEPPTA